MRSIGIQFSEMCSKVIWCGEAESEVRLPRNPIGQSGTNRNPVFRNGVLQKLFGADNPNLRFICLDILLVG